MRGSAQSMASVAKATLAYYAANTLSSVLLGIMLVSLLRPGRGSPLSSAAGSCGVDVTEVSSGGWSWLAYLSRGSMTQLWGQHDGGDLWSGQCLGICRDAQGCTAAPSVGHPGSCWANRRCMMGRMCSCGVKMMEVISGADPCPRICRRLSDAAAALVGQPSSSWGDKGEWGEGWRCMVCTFQHSIAAAGFSCKCLLRATGRHKAVLTKVSCGVALCPHLCA